MSNGENIWNWNFQTRIIARTGSITLGQHRITKQFLVARDDNSSKWTPLKSFTTDDWLDDDTANFWKKEWLSDTEADQ